MIATSRAMRIQIIAAAVCALASAAVLGLALALSGPLVTLHPEGAFALGAAVVPGGAVGEDIAGQRYSSWNGNDALTGRLVSDRFVANELDRHQLAELQVPRGDHDAHAARPDGALHAVLPRDDVALAYREGAWQWHRKIGN